MPPKQLNLAYKQAHKQCSGLANKEERTTTSSGCIFLHHRNFRRPHKCDSKCSSTKAPSTAQPVCVRLLVMWQVKIDDQVDVLQVDATCKDVGRDHDAQGQRAQCAQHGEPGGLREARRDVRGGDSKR